MRVIMSMNVLMPSWSYLLLMSNACYSNPAVNAALTAPRGVVSRCDRASGAHAGAMTRRPVCFSVGIAAARPRRGPNRL